MADNPQLKLLGVNIMKIDPVTKEVRPTNVTCRWRDKVCNRTIRFAVMNKKFEARWFCSGHMIEWMGISTRSFATSMNELPTYPQAVNNLEATFEKNII